jgi:hypothetical protein
MMIKYQYMSDAQADAIYGRLCREVSKLGRDIALYEAELKKVGKSLGACPRIALFSDFCAVSY